MPAAKKIASAPRQPRMSAEEKRWRAEDDLRVMQRAEEIKADSSRLAEAKRLAQTQVKALTKVAGKK